MHKFKLIVLSVVILLITGCISVPPAYDYSEFRNSDPHSILLLPPINNSAEVLAPYSLMAQITAPIAEAGFYVYPVALVDETSKNNGLTVAKDVHNVPVDKLHEISGAHTALYISIEQYGTSYNVISSDTVV